MERFSHFKKIILAVSCDDIEEQYEHIRFPGKWETITSNLNKLKQNNIEITRLTSCVGIYSIFSPIRLYNHFSKLGYETYSFRTLRAPEQYDIAYLPDDVKIKVIDTYKASNLPEKWKNFICGYLENSMNKYEHISQNHINKFVTHMDNLDSIRGTDWKNTFPDVVDLLKDYINKKPI